MKQVDVKMNGILELRSYLEPYGQEQILQFWDQLSESDRNVLRQDISELNIKEATDFFKIANDSVQLNQEKLDDLMKPISSEFSGSVLKSPPDVLKSYENEGLKQISEGHVGVLLLAGGQGTRLGVTYPKGMYNVGLPSHKPLFQIQAERIIKLQNLAKAQFSKDCHIVWYIMTSDATMEQTLQFFQKHQYFGLNSKNIVMFEQGMLPCFDFRGKILLNKKNKISKSPDGNGGLYRALRNENILADMEQRGIKYLHAYSVDNILVRVADPVFLGYCVKKGADCGAKVVEKISPTEPVGVVCSVDGKIQVVEYSEITLKTAELTNKDGHLVFNAGNICNHFFTTDFLKDVAHNFESKLKLHVAKKKIPFVDNSGERITPEKPNGIKIEKFVFDVFPFASNFVTWEVPREEEFSALKNSEAADKDNPKTSRQDIFTLHRLYITRAGGEVIGDGACEISPLLSYSGEGLESYCSGQVFHTPVLLTAPNEKVIQNGFH